MKQEDKRQVVDELHAALSESSAGIVTHYRGLSVLEMSDLRRRLKSFDISLRVVKNSLIRRAAEGTDFKVVDPLFTGPVAIAYGSDPVGMAKAISEFSSKHEAFEVKGGVLDGKLIDASDIDALASLPSRDVLLAKMLGSMQSPISGFVRTLNEIPSSFVRVLAAVRDQKES